MNKVDIAKKLFYDFWSRRKKDSLKYTYEELIQLIFVYAADGKNYLQVSQRRVDKDSIEKLKKDKFIVELYKNQCRIVIPI